MCNLLSFDLNILSWSHHHRQDNEYIHHHQKFPPAPLYSCLLSLCLTPGNHWSALCLQFLEFYITRINYFFGCFLHSPKLFWDSLMSCISIVHCFFMLDSIPLCGYVTICLFTHMWMDGHVGCFQLEAITNKTALSICLQVFQIFAWVNTQQWNGCVLWLVHNF